MTATDSTFKAAIPGMSLTHKMGDLPHEKPPKFVEKNAALEHVWGLLNQPNILRHIWDIARQGGTAYSIARAILYKAATMGIIQLNLGVLMYPTVQKMIIVICKSHGIDIKIHPPMRDSVYDQTKQKQINDKLTRQHNPAVPPSALKSQQYPKAEDITKGHKALLKGKYGQGEANTSRGLLNMAGDGS